LVVRGNQTEQMAKLNNTALDICPIHGRNPSASLFSR
jgi:hypothetical protein